MALGLTSSRSMCPGQGDSVSWSTKPRGLPGHRSLSLEVSLHQLCTMVTSESPDFLPSAQGSHGACPSQDSRQEATWPFMATKVMQERFEHILLVKAATKSPKVKGGDMDSASSWGR